MGTFAPTRPGDVDLADAAHAVLVEVGPDRIGCFSSALEVGQLVEEALALDIVQEGDDFWVRADHVRDVEELQPHLRRDVVGDGLCERVGRVLLAQPLLELLVEPPRRFHRRHEHLMALRIEQEPSQLLDVRQDEVEQRRSGLRPDVALQRGDGSLVAPDQLGDDGRIVLDRGRRAAKGRLAGRLVRKRRDEVAAFEDGLQRVPEQRVAPPHDLEEVGAARRRHQALGDVDEQPPAGLGHGPGGRQLPKGEPQRLHGVGHHLLMTDGEVDVVGSVADLRDGEQRGDRPALNDLETVIDQAPFDVLGAAEVRLDPPAQPRQLHDLRVCQRRLLLLRRLDRLFLCSTCRRGVDGTLLGGDRLGDDVVVAHLVDVGVHPAGDQGLAEAEDGLHGGDLPVGRDGVGREDDAGRPREDHLLHDHGHVDPPVVEAVPQAVGHGPLGEQRGPAPADVLQDRRRPYDVQVRVRLACEGGRRRVLRRRARSDGVGGSLAEPGECVGDRRRQIVRDDDPFEGPSDLRAARAESPPDHRGSGPTADPADPRSTARPP